MLVTRYTEEAVRFLRDNGDKPFFLYLPHSAVHFPLYPGKAFQGKSRNGLYGDWVEEVDWSVGQVLDTVRADRLADQVDEIAASLAATDLGVRVRQGRVRHVGSVEAEEVLCQ